MSHSNITHVSGIEKIPLSDLKTQIIPDMKELPVPKP